MKTVRAFARLAGVTPKTLRHYERQRLLAPRRNAAGYRLYSERDRKRICEIVSLKALGLPLSEIRGLLVGRAEPMDVLRRHREALEAKRRSLDHAITVIREVERATADDPSRAALETLLAEAQWSDAERKREQANPEPRPADRASPSRIALAHETLRAIDAGNADGLREKWLARIAEETAAHPELAAQMARAYEKRRHWPRGMREWLASTYEMDVESFERLAAFIADLTEPRTA